MKPIAVIIPTYNNLSELKTCLRALSQQTHQNFIAYVCVDGSTDGTLAYLAERPYDFIRVLTHPDGRNRGRSAARNLVRPYLAQHEWVAFLDSDAIPLPNWLERYLAQNPTPKEVLLGQILYYSDFMPNPWVEYRRWREHQRRKRKPDFRGFHTPNAFLHAETLRQVGGFDEQIRRHGLEDIELGWRLACRGLSFRYVAEAITWSASQQTPLEALQRAYEMGRYNLPYLHQVHPETRLKLFRGYWFIQPLRKYVLRSLFAVLPPRRMYPLVEQSPAWLSNRILQYLLLYSVSQGYWQQNWALARLKRKPKHKG